MFVSGESCTGRTEFTKKSLKGKLIASPRESIVWCYAKVLQDLFEEILTKSMDYVESIPGKLHIYFKKNEKNLSILDDLMGEASKRALKILNCLEVVVMTTFPLSIPGIICSIKINMFLVIFKNPWDNSQFASITRQIRPDKTKFLKNMQSQLCISTWCLIWKQTPKKSSKWETRFWKIQNMYI